MALSGIAGASCSGDGSDSGEHECTPVRTPVEFAFGQLSLGTFRWVCVGEGDPTCGSGGFPAAVAVGSRFNLTFTEDADLPNEIGANFLEPVSDVVVPDGTGFRVERSGVVTMVALSSNAAVDFVDLELRSVSRITLSRLPDPPGTDEWGCEVAAPAPAEGDSADTYVGEGATVQAMPYADSTRLAGSLQYEWESLTPEVLTVTPYAGREARLDGKTVGTARIAIRAGDHEEIVEVTVEEAPPSADSGGETGDVDTGGTDDTGTGGTGGECVPPPDVEVGTVCGFYADGVNFCQHGGALPPECVAVEGATCQEQFDDAEDTGPECVAATEALYLCYLEGGCPALEAGCEAEAALVDELCPDGGTGSTGDAGETGDTGDSGGDTDGGSDSGGTDGASGTTTGGAR